MLLRSQSRTYFCPLLPWTGGCIKNRLERVSMCPPCSPTHTEFLAKQQHKHMPTRIMFDRLPDLRPPICRTASMAAQKVAPSRTISYVWREQRRQDVGVGARGCLCRCVGDASVCAAFSFANMLETSPCYVCICGFKDMVQQFFFLPPASSCPGAAFDSAPVTSYAHQIHRQTLCTSA